MAFALAWARAHSPVPMLELTERPTFPYGSTPSGSYGRHAWIIRNAGAVPLRIRTRFTSGRSGFSLWQGEEHVLDPGVEITVHLTWLAPTHLSVPFSSYATLRTNDPERPEFRLRIVGTSGPALAELIPTISPSSTSLP